jgi:hypothetical protein
VLPNPWVLLGAFAVWASTLVGCWFYKGHVDNFQLQATVATIATQRDQAVIKAQQDAAKTVAAQAAKTQEISDALQTEQAKHAADLVAADDMHKRLLDAVALYASGAGLPAATELSVLKGRLETLSGIYGDMASAGEQAAADADTDAEHLRACEAYSKVVQPQ